MEALESEGSEDDRPDSTGAALLARIKRQRTLVPGMIEPVMRDDGSGLLVQTAPAMPMLDGFHKANSKVAAVSRLLQQSGAHLGVSFHALFRNVRPWDGGSSCSIYLHCHVQLKSQN